MNNKIEQDTQENEAITNILGVGVSAINERGCREDRPVDRAGRRRYVCVSSVNVLWNAAVISARHSQPGRHGHPDGMPLVWLNRLSGKKRFSGVRMTFCSQSANAPQTGWSTTLRGRPWALGRMQARLADLFPGLNIAGAESPPFRPLTEARPGSSRSDQRFRRISLGGPGRAQTKYWMADHLERIKVPVMIGVGAADFHAGTRSRRPLDAAQRAGMVLSAVQRTKAFVEALLN